MNTFADRFRGSALFEDSGVERRCVVPGQVGELQSFGDEVTDNAALHHNHQ